MVITLVFLFWMQVSAADTSALLPDVRIEAARVRLTPDRFPQSVQIRTPELDAISAGGLDSRLRSLPGLTLYNRETLALGERLQIRGMGWRSAFGVRGVTVLLDGLPLTAPDGSSVLEPIDAGFIRQVELIRGPTSGLWGNASGGTLYLRTMPEASQTGWRMATEAGAYGTRLIRAEAAGKRMAGHLSYATSEGYRDHSRYEILRGQTVWRHRNGETRMHGSWMPEALNPGPLADSTARDHPQSIFPLNRQRGTSKSFTHGILSHTRRFGDTEAQAILTHRRLRNPTLAEIVELDRLQATVRIQNRTWEAVTTGIDLNAQSDDRTHRQNLNGDPGNVTLDDLQTFLNASPYLLVTVPRGPFTIMGSLRTDVNAYATRVDGASPLFMTPNGSVGLGYRSGAHALYANLGTSTENPGMNERINAVEAVGPERTLGAEIGYRGDYAGGWHQEVAIYAMRTSGRILPTTGPIPLKTYYRNAGEADFRGAEWSGGWRGPAAGMLLTSQISQFRLDNDNRIPGVAEAQHQVEAHVQVAGLRLGTHWLWSGSQAVNEANTVWNEGWLVGEASLGAEQRIRGMRMRASVRVRNLLDARYNGSVQVNPFNNRAYEPAPGRHVMLGLVIRQDRP
jgi:iron complex outermembrane recepter protein